MEIVGEGGVVRGIARASERSQITDNLSKLEKTTERGKSSRAPILHAAVDLTAGQFMRRDVIASC